MKSIHVDLIQASGVRKGALCGCVLLESAGGVGSEGVLVTEWIDRRCPTPRTRQRDIEAGGPELVVRGRHLVEPVAGLLSAHTHVFMRGEHHQDSLRRHRVLLSNAYLSIGRQTAEKKGPSAQARATSRTISSSINFMRLGPPSHLATSRPPSSIASSIDAVADTSPPTLKDPSRAPSSRIAWRCSV